MYKITKATKEQCRIQLQRVCGDAYRIGVTVEMQGKNTMFYANASGKSVLVLKIQRRLNAIEQDVRVKGIRTFINNEGNSY